MPVFFSYWIPIVVRCTLEKSYPNLTTWRFIDDYILLLPFLYIEGCPNNVLHINPCIGDCIAASLIVKREVIEDTNLTNRDGHIESIRS